MCSAFSLGSARPDGLSRSPPGEKLLGSDGQGWVEVTWGDLSCCCNKNQHHGTELWCQTWPFWPHSGLKEGRTHFSEWCPCCAKFPWPVISLFHIYLGCLSLLKCTVLEIWTLVMAQRPPGPLLHWWADVIWFWSLASCSKKVFFSQQGSLILTPTFFILNTVFFPTDVAQRRHCSTFTSRFISGEKNVKEWHKSNRGHGSTWRAQGVIFVMIFQNDSAAPAAASTVKGPYCPVQTCWRGVVMHLWARRRPDSSDTQRRLVLHGNSAESEMWPYRF